MQRGNHFDLSPIIIKDILGHVLKSPLEFVPEIEGDQIAVSSHFPFCFYYSTDSRAELEKLIREFFEILWLNYAEEEKDALTPGAQKMREKLLGLI